MSSHYRVYLDEGRITPLDDSERDYLWDGNLTPTIHPEEGESYYLLHVDYRQGSSEDSVGEFRREFVDIYRTREEAILMAKAIREHVNRALRLRWRWQERPKDWDEHYQNITYGSGETKRTLVPWTGYFEAVCESGVVVREVRLGEPSIMRF